MNEKIPLETNLNKANDILFHTMTAEKTIEFLNSSPNGLTEEEILKDELSMVLMLLKKGNARL